MRHCPHLSKTCIKCTLYNNQYNDDLKELDVININSFKSSLYWLLYRVHFMYVLLKFASRHAGAGWGDRLGTRAHRCTQPWSVNTNLVGDPPFRVGFLAQAAACILGLAQLSPGHHLGAVPFLFAVAGVRPTTDIAVHKAACD